MTGAHQPNKNTTNEKRTVNTRMLDEIDTILSNIPHKYHYVIM